MATHSACVSVAEAAVHSELADTHVPLAVVQSDSVVIEVRMHDPTATVVALSAVTLQIPVTKQAVSVVADGLYTFVEAESVRVMSSR